MKYYNTLLGKSFNQNDQKRLGFGAFACCLVIALTLCTVFKPFVASIFSLNIQLVAQNGRNVIKSEEFNISYVMGANIVSEVKHEATPVVNLLKPNSSEQRKPIFLNLPKSSGTKPTLHNDTSAVLEEAKAKIKNVGRPIICNFSEPRSDICEMNGNVRVHGSLSTIFFPSPDNISDTWSIRPYARKDDAIAMKNVTRITIKTTLKSPKGNNLPICTHNHSIPAVIFSTSGYIGNHFHDFTDVIIPLFLTSREFNGEVQFMVTNKDAWWLNKYIEVLKSLSKYEIIDLDKEDKVHCFPKVIVGLRHHKEFGIDPLKSQFSIGEFRNLLRNSYSLKKETAIKLGGKLKRKPRLLMITRKKTRSFMNEMEIVKMAQSLGFEVILAEANANLKQFAQLVNSCDVMMGVHGAGLTNIVFLPENAILVQIVPLGKMDWLAKTDFGIPSMEMNLRYLEYQIVEHESSLIKQYPIDHPVIKDPYSVTKKGWFAYRSVYMDKQDVNLDVNRFKPTLLKTLELLYK
ncbi:alpha-1,3-arabinosyltransferase XAT3-like [Impatiens glandulifera]|uniref:alpha-1,3-arabinosyltransferase XAT3-like n=1 Tax=Impatiens glandulifera TaxID=253017 RepID=UPI001FB17522|nr:alpha-1,3-arabinosyltransferase XAT3-like [Impatiens glandulifera]